MSIIQKIRDKSAILIFALIVLSLIAFILQDAFVGQSSKYGSDEQNLIGKIGKNEISKMEFDTYLDNYEKQYQNQGIEVTPEIKASLIKSVWDALIFSKSVSQEVNILGLSISQSEFQSLFFGANIHPYIKQQFVNPQTGIFEEKSVRAYLQQMKNLKDNNPDKKRFLQSLVRPILESEFSNKLQSLLIKSIYTPTWMIDKLQAQNAQLSKIQLLRLPYTTIQDSALKKDDDKELNSFVQTRFADLLQRDDTKTLKVVEYKIVPSISDTLLALTKINSLKQKFALTLNTKNFLTANGVKTGNSDIFLHLNDFNPSEKSIIERLREGQIVGPILQDHSYNLYKLLAKKPLPDSVACRHILISTASGKHSEEEAKKIIDSVVGLLKGGAKFEDLVKNFSDDDGSKQTKGQYIFAYNQINQLVPEFSNAIFFGKTNDKKIIKTDLGYHYVEVLNQKPATLCYKVGIVGKTIEAGKQTIDSIYNVASSFIASATTMQEFIKTAQQNKINISTITVAETDFTSDIGYVRPLIKWAFESKLDNVSNIISVGDNLYVGIISAESHKGEVTPNTLPNYVLEAYKQQKQYELLLKQVQGVGTLSGIADKYHEIIQIVSDVSFNKSQLEEFGFEPNVVASAFNKNKFKKIQYVNGATGLYAIVVDDLYTSSSSVTNSLTTTAQLNTQLQNQVSNSLTEYFKKQNTVKDFRKNFF